MPFFQALLVVVLSALGGCTATQFLTVTPEQLGDYWMVRGKIGCLNGRQSGSLTFRWHQTEEDYRVHLSAPLGRVNIQLIGSSEGFKMIDGKGQQYDMQAAREYVDRLAGVTLPIQALPYWLRALPAPTEETISLTAEGFKQYDWLVSSRQPVSASGQLPALVQIASPPVLCKIALWGWQPLPVLESPAP